MRSKPIYIDGPGPATSRTPPHGMGPGSWLRTWGSRTEHGPSSFFVRRHHHKQCHANVIKKLWSEFSSSANDQLLLYWKPLQISIVFNTHAWYVEKVKQPWLRGQEDGAKCLPFWNLYHRSNVFLPSTITPQGWGGRTQTHGGGGGGRSQDPAHTYIYIYI